MNLLVAVDLAAVFTARKHGVHSRDRVLRSLAFDRLVFAALVRLGKLVYEVKRFRAPCLIKALLIPAVGYAFCLVQPHCVYVNV